MTRPLIHPGLMTSLADFFPRLAAIQENTPARDGAGQPIAVWSTVVGLEAVPCRVAPSTQGTPAEEELRAQLLITDRRLFVVSLRGYYPTITTAMRAIVDLVAYDLLAVEHDSQHVYTRLLAEIVSV